MRTHGLASAYRAGCRCEPCTKANSDFLRDKRAERAQRPADEVPHGLSGYKNWLCRCEICKAAGSVDNARRSRRKADAS